MLNKIFTVSALASLALAAPAPAALPDTSSLDLVTLLNQTKGFSYLSTHVGQVPALSAALKSLTNVTVLAPSDIALRLFPWDPRYEELEDSDIDYFQALIGYHIINGVYDNLTESFAPYQTAVRSAPWTTLPGGQVVMGRYDYRTFETAFFGGRDTLAQAPVQMKFSGGVVYAIDDVLNIPRGLTAELTDPAVNTVNGTRFITALGQAGLLDEVENLKEATYFVPTDEAFKAVEKSIYGLSKEELAAVLRYHIIDGKALYSPSVKNGTTFKTLQGQDVKINQQRRLFVQNARIMKTDVLTKNGVVHMIDNVLSPEFTPKAQNATQNAGEPAFPVGPGFY